MSRADCEKIIFTFYLQEIYFKMKCIYLCPDLGGWKVTVYIIYMRINVLIFVVIILWSLSVRIFWMKSYYLHNLHSFCCPHLWCYYQLIAFYPWTSLHTNIFWKIYEFISFRQSQLWIKYQNRPVSLTLIGSQSERRKTLNSKPAWRDYSALDKITHDTAAVYMRCLPKTLTGYVTRGVTITNTPESTSKYFICPLKGFKGVYILYPLHFCI